MLQRPLTGDYAAYFETYIKLVPQGDLIGALEAQLSGTLAKLSDLTEEQASYRYAPGKWSVKELIGHLSDTERVMGYRLLLAARGDKTPLPPFDEELYVNGAEFDLVSLRQLLESFEGVRAATLHLLRTMQPEAWQRRGNVNGFEVTPLALACIIAGHELHHRKVLEERYLAEL
jgi:hypothetical protein